MSAESPYPYPLSIYIYIYLSICIVAPHRLYWRIINVIQLNSTRLFIFLGGLIIYNQTMSLSSLQHDQPPSFRLYPRTYNNVMFYIGPIDLIWRQTNDDITNEHTNNRQTVGLGYTYSQFI